MKFFAIFNPFLGIKGHNFRINSLFRGSKTGPFLVPFWGSQKRPKKGPKTAFSGPKIRFLGILGGPFRPPFSPPFPAVNRGPSMSKIGPPSGGYPPENRIFGYFSPFSVKKGPFLGSNLGAQISEWAKNV